MPVEPHGGVISKLHVELNFFFLREKKLWNVHICMYLRITRIHVV